MSVLFCPRCDYPPTTTDDLVQHLMTAHGATLVEAQRRAAEVVEEVDDLDADRRQKAGAPVFRCPLCRHLRTTMRTLLTHLEGPAHGLDPAAAAVQAGTLTIDPGPSAPPKEEPPMPVPTTPWVQRKCGRCGHAGHRRDHCPEATAPKRVHRKKPAVTVRTSPGGGITLVTGPTVAGVRAAAQVLTAPTAKGLLAQVQEELAPLRAQVAELESVERFLRRRATG